MAKIWINSATEDEDLELGSVPILRSIPGLGSIPTHQDQSHHLKSPNIQILFQFDPHHKATT